MLWLCSPLVGSPPLGLTVALILSCRSPLLLLLLLPLRILTVLAGKEAVGV